MANLTAVLLLCLLMTGISCYVFPLYKQCDQPWGKQTMGTTLDTICSHGCLISSVAMALFAIGNTQLDPSTLNQWLTNNGGYDNGDDLVWNAIDAWGVNFINKVSRDQIKGYLDQNYFVFPNVNQGHHWVLATGYEGDTLKVLDSYYDRTTYELS